MMEISVIGGQCVKTESKIMMLPPVLHVKCMAISVYFPCLEKENADKLDCEVSEYRKVYFMQ